MVATFGQFKSFNAVARAGSFTRAAQRLGVSQPAITAQVRRLEVDHDVVLFERTATGVQLTPQGRRLFRVTQSLDDLEEAALVLLGGRDEAVPQVLRIATASPQVFMPMIAAFSRRHGDVELEVAVGSTGDALRRLLDREADIALTPVIRDDDRLDHVVHARQHLSVMVPAGHPMARAESVSLHEAVEEPLIMRLGVSMTQKVVDQALAMHGLRTTPVLRLETREAVHEAVAARLGIALVLEHDVPPDPRLRLIPLLDCDLVAEECIVWLRSRRSMGLINDFLAVAQSLPGAAAGGPTPPRPARADHANDH